MAHEFRLPDIGEGLTEATIITWFVAVGDPVAIDGPLVEVETDKAVVEIPAPVAGTLLHQGAAEGTVIEVASLLAVIGEPGEVWTATPEEPSDTEQVAPIVGRLDVASEPLPARARVPALPAVRRLAADLGVAIEQLAGTGPGGRVTEDDVRAAAAHAGPARTVPLTATRRAIARNLTRSWQEIPHVTTYGTADAEAVLAERTAQGKPPLEALLISRVVPLLAAHPAFNATYRGDTIVEHLRYDIGVAVDTADGLMVAVVRGADAMSIPELGREITDLAAGARARSLPPERLTGQTFTVSNIGAVGGRFGTPIIPYGTTAILSIGRADPAPAVRDGEVVVARELPLSLSYDHRVIDGASGRAFMVSLVAALEA